MDGLQDKSVNFMVRKEVFMDRERSQSGLSDRDPKENTDNPSGKGNRKVGRSELRVDGFDKASGRTKYYEDRIPQGALFVRIRHSEIAHGIVKSVDKSGAEAIPGVVKVLTCFDVPDITFPTAMTTATSSP